MNKNLLVLACSLTFLFFTQSTRAQNNLNVPPPALSASLPVPGVPLTVGANSQYGQSLYEFTRFVLYDVAKVPFFFTREFLNSKIEIAFSKENLNKNNAIQLLSEVLQRNGFRLVKTQMFYVVEPIPEPTEKDKPQEEKHFLFYKPKFRPVSYLREAVAPYIDEPQAQQTLSQKSPQKTQTTEPAQQTTAQTTSRVEIARASSSSVSSGETSSFSSSNEQDIYVFRGTEKQIKIVQEIIANVDFEPIKVSVKTKFIEVSKIGSNRTGIKVVGDLLGGALKGSAKISLGSAGPSSSNVITIGTNFQVIGDALNSANDVSILAQPEIVLNSGTSKTLKSTYKIPYVTGSIVQNGSTQTTTAFIEAGTILTVKPTVLEGSVNLVVSQEQSDQVASDLSSSAPSIFQRNIPTEVNIKPGDALLIGGLRYSKSSKVKSGLFGWNLGKQTNEDEREIVLLVYVDIVQ